MQTQRNSTQETTHEIIDIDFVEVGKCPTISDKAKANLQPVERKPSVVAIAIRKAIARIPRVSVVDMLEVLMLLIGGIVKLIVLVIFGILFAIMTLVFILCKPLEGLFRSVLPFGDVLEPKAPASNPTQGSDAGINVNITINSHNNNA